MAKKFPNYIRSAAKHSDALLYEAWGYSAYRRKGLKMTEINFQYCVYGESLATNFYAVTLSLGAAIQRIIGVSSSGSD